MHIQMDVGTDTVITVKKIESTPRPRAPMFHPITAPVLQITINQGPEEGAQSVQVMLNEEEADRLVQSISFLT